MTHLHNLIGQHLDYIQYNKEKSINTVKSRRWALQNFVSSVNANCVDDITLVNVNKWIIAQRKCTASKGNRLSGKSINDRMSHLKSFVTWLEREGIDVKIRFHLVERADEVKHEAVCFTRAQIQGILAVADMREALMINILFDTLMRRAELSSLRIENFKGREVRYIGKGNKPSRAFISDETAKLLDEWVEFYRIDGYIFPSADGHLAPDSVSRIIRGVCARAGLKEGHAHAFRHSSATDLELNGAPIELISKLLNHSKIDTSRLYTHGTDLNLVHIRDRFARSLA